MLCPAADLADLHSAEWGSHRPYRLGSPVGAHSSREGKENMYLRTENSKYTSILDVGERVNIYPVEPGRGAGELLQELGNLVVYDMSDANPVHAGVVTFVSPRTDQDLSAVYQQGEARLIGRNGEVVAFL